MEPEPEPVPEQARRGSGRALRRAEEEGGWGGVVTHELLDGEKRPVHLLHHHIIPQH